MALNSELPCDGIHQIEAESGYSHPTVVRALQALRAAGYASQPRYRTWLITERGKIALAIHAGREHRRRHGLSLSSHRLDLLDVLVRMPEANADNPSAVAA